MKKIAVIGAGQMGAGIVQVSAQAGYQVVMSDLSLENAQKAKAFITKQLERAVSKEKIEAKAAEETLNRITPVDNYDAMADADMVIEAATEREDIKRKIFEDVGKLIGKDAILASNTSSIPITRMAQASPDPARFVGVHFFNPVPIMGLIELIRGLATSDETVEKVRDYAAAIGKRVVQANDAPGFVVNRVFAAHVE